MSASRPTSSLPSSVFPVTWSLANLQEHLGGIPLERIRLVPPPGLATVEDALRLDDQKDCLCELVDGVLVEKVMGSYESVLAMMLGHYINTYLEKSDLGIVSGPDGQLLLFPAKMRIPDVAFISWNRFPDGKLPKDRVFHVAPDLAVEILSKGNTPQEMERKLEEYFEAGVRMVWYIEPVDRTARLYTARDQQETIDENGWLRGGEVLPGFELKLANLFERTDRRVAPEGD